MFSGQEALTFTTLLTLPYFSSPINICILSPKQQPVNSWRTIEKTLSMERPNIKIQDETIKIAGLTALLFLCELHKYYTLEQVFRSPDQV